MGILELIAWPLRRRQTRLFTAVVLFLGVLYIVYDQQSTKPTRNDAGRHDLSVPQGLAYGSDGSGDNVIRPTSHGRVLVTGGGGMIGKHMISRLLSSGTPVTILDLSLQRDELQSVRELYPTGDLTYIEGDVRDAKTLAKAISKDIVGVIHLAGYSRVNYCEENKKDCLDVNVKGTEKVLARMITNVKKGWFIYPSSGQVYGNANSFPVREIEVTKAVNTYAASKIAAEQAVRKYTGYAAKSGSKMNSAILRLSTVYGSTADHESDFVADVMANALAHRPIQVAGGEQETDLVFIGDVVDAISQTITRLNEITFGEKAQHGQVEMVNIGTKDTVKAVDLIRKVMSLTNSSSPLQTIPGDQRLPHKYSPDVSHAKEVLGFEASIGIDEGLYRLVTVYMAETITYLTKKRQHECHEGRSYDINDLLKLDGCSGTLAADLDGQPFYAFYDPEKPDDPNNGKKASPQMWAWRDDDEPQAWDFEIKKEGSDATIRLSRVIPEKEDDKGNVLEKERTVYFQTEDAHVYDLTGSFAAKVNPDTTKFGAAVNPLNGYISLRSMTGESLVPWNPFEPPGRKRAELPDPSVTELGDYRFRITPFCCPGRQAPWPFFRDDPLASGILDHRIDKQRVFSASQIDTLCERLEKAEDVVHARIDALRKLQEATPFTIELAPLPTGKPADWRMRNRDVCTNLCDHPTICLDTGDCACAQAACPPRPRFPFSHVANVDRLSYELDSQLDWSTVESSGGQLAKDVSKGSWLNILRPAARRYLIQKPDFHPINVTRLPDADQKSRDSDAEKYDKIQTEWHGCFSADSVMERGAKLVSTAYHKDSLVFLPYYSYTLRFPPVVDWTKNALEHNLPPGVDTSDFIIPYTFDWGRCNTILHGLYRVRDWSFVPPEVTRASSWQPMGDLNSQCYYMDQDVVIPARTCRQEDLRKMFSSIAHVKPARKRSTLVFFKGAPNGAGTSIRTKVACERPYKDIKGRLTGANEKARYWNKYRPDTAGMSNEAAYLSTIGDTIFCPVPRGTAGWSPRITDTLYAGCIPVLLGDQTHEPFWDIIDWSKISVQVNDYEVERLEHILLSYTWEEIEEMQANLMLIRQAFLYPNEGDMEDNLKEHGPFFFAMHSAGLLKRTAFPT